MKRKIILLLSSFLLLAGCGGLPDQIKERAKAMPDSFKKAEEMIAKEEADYQKQKQGSEFKDFLAPYAQKEKWDDKFSEARKALADAKLAFEKDFVPILKRNKSEEEKAAFSQLAIVEGFKREAQGFAKHHDVRGRFLVKARAEAPEWRKTALKEAGQMRSITAGILKYAGVSKANHPGKKEDIAMRVAQAEKWQKEAGEAEKTVNKEFQSKLPDYAAFADSSTLITKNLALITDYDKKLKAKLAELDRSYSKTLTDMRVDYYIKVGRVSWEESEAIEWPSETAYDYQVRQIDEATFEYFDKLPDDQDLAFYSTPGFFGGGLKLNVDQGMWSRLNINPTESWPHSDNQANLYIAEFPVKFYHKYVIVENGEKKETGWVEVDEAYFEQNDGHIGMDLVAKPFGMYEDETIKVASPPGMAYVGNTRYGSWRPDGHGGSFWEFYGRYRMFGDMMGSNRYYRRDWDDWNTNYRGRQPYYGEDKDGRERFGSGSSHAQTRYAGSHYSKTGGFKGEDQSVRQAGPRTRGGGPGGGGK